MAKPVLLTAHAYADLENISVYLSENWGTSVLENFIILYDSKIKIISEYPGRYPLLHQPSQLRKAVLTKHNIILYREKEEHIEIISIFDTRQNPDRINTLL
jgi:plasmid stabilization system protein ParE